MSAASMVWAFEQQVGNPALKLLLVKISDGAGFYDDGAGGRHLVTPDVETLAQVVEVSVEQVRIGIERLVEHRYLRPHVGDEAEFELVMP